MSKFSRLLEEAKQGKESPAPMESADVESKPARTKAKATASRPATKAAGKPTGRRSDPNYIGVFAYIPKTLNEDVKTRLVKSKEHDFSSLVETLLQQWFSKQH